MQILQAVDIKGITITQKMSCHFWDTLLRMWDALFNDAVGYIQKFL